MKKANTQKLVDLNDILKWITILLLVLIWVSYQINGNNQYVNIGTIIWGSILAIEMLIFLKVEKRRRDPFVIVLCFQIIFFYLLRVLTLSVYPFSFVFDRYPFGAHELNNGLSFIIAANVALFFGLYLNKVKVGLPPYLTDAQPSKPYLIYVVLFFVYFMSYSSALNIGALSILTAFVSNLFINITVIMFMIVNYLIIFSNKLKQRNKIILTIGLLFYVVISTLSGSRSAIITISYYLLFTSLSVFGLLKIKKLYLFLVTLFVPVLIVFFTVATYLRPRLENRASVGGEVFDLLKDFDLKETFSSNSELILSPIFGRVAFLDFGAEVMANKDKYAQVFNFKYYAKSIVDNVLTPGFDVFNTPKASNALTFIYNNEGVPKKTKVADVYQSDEFTFYGEMFCLFGNWFSLVPIFFIAFLFKRFYIKIKASNQFLYYVKHSFALYIFYIMLNSFGFDWVIFDSLGIIFTYLIFKSFFKFKPNLNGVFSEKLNSLT